MASGGRVHASLGDQGHQPRSSLVALGHQSLLRTIEALGTRACDYSLACPFGHRLPDLLSTKTSTRHGRNKRIIFEDPGLMAGAAEPSKGLTPGDSICPVSATAFRNNSAAAVHGRGWRTWTSGSRACGEAAQQITFAKPTVCKTRLCVAGKQTSPLASCT